MATKSRAIKKAAPNKKPVTNKKQSTSVKTGDMKKLARLKEVTAELKKRRPESEKLFDEKFKLMKNLGLTIDND